MMKWLSEQLEMILVWSDRISIWYVKTFPFTLGHINVSLKKGIYISSSIPTPYANLTPFTSMKALNMFCILLIISSFQYQRTQQERVRHQHWKDRLVSLPLMKMIVSWASVTCFQFHSRQLAFVVSTTKCIYSCPVLSGMRPRPPPEVVWAIGYRYLSRMRFGGHLHLVFSEKNAWSDQV